MGTLRLIEPTVRFEKEHAGMLKEWYEAGERIVPFSLAYDSSDFTKYIMQINAFKKGIGIPDRFVPHSTFWLINEKQRILGVSNIRHFLNERLLIEGGHIGYGIRPSERKKGYATEILKLSLEEARKLEIKDVLLTCNKENTGSSRTIIKNGGILCKEHVFEGGLTQNYWIKYPEL